MEISEHDVGVFSTQQQNVAGARCSESDVKWSSGPRDGAERKQAKLKLDVVDATRNSYRATSFLLHQTPASLVNLRDNLDLTVQS